MGIARGMARLLLDEAKKRRFHGSVLQLGRQAIYFTMKDLSKWASLHKVRLTHLEPDHNNRDAETAFLDDITFFSALGFESVESCDISGFEGATHIFDFNQPAPNQLHGRYDAIFDGGTIEHIFHVPNVMSNIHKMLKVGGRIIHGTPSSNHVDHGFYMFSPTFFYDYYSANNFQIDTIYIFEYTMFHDRDPWKIYHYEPGSIDHLSFGGFGDSMVGIYCTATKTENSTSDVIPHQGYYKKLLNL